MTGWACVVSALPAQRVATVGRAVRSSTAAPSARGQRAGPGPTRRKQPRARRPSAHGAPRMDGWSRSRSAPIPNPAAGRGRVSPSRAARPAPSPRSPRSTRTLGDTRRSSLSTQGRRAQVYTVRALMEPALGARGGTPFEVLDDVRDEDLFALDARSRECVVEDPSSRTDERTTRVILLVAGLLPHEHQVGGDRADPEHGLGRAGPQVTGGAVRRQRGERRPVEPAAIDASQCLLRHSASGIDGDRRGHVPALSAGGCPGGRPGRQCHSRCRSKPHRPGRRRRGAGPVAAQPRRKVGQPSRTWVPRWRVPLSLALADTAGPSRQGRCRSRHIGRPEAWMPLRRGRSSPTWPCPPPVRPRPRACRGRSPSRCPRASESPARRPGRRSSSPQDRGPRRRVASQRRRPRARSLAVGRAHRCLRDRPHGPVVLPRRAWCVIDRWASPRRDPMPCRHHQHVGR